MLNDNCQILDINESEEVPLEPKDYNAILNVQQTILNDIAHNLDTQAILDHLCKLAESLLPNAVASIMFKNTHTGLLSVRAAPSVPKEGHDALKDLKPGPTSGSCGNAVFHATPQYVTNTLTDKRWEDLRDLAVDFNLRSCWSMPVLNSEKKAIGTFALSSFEHRAPAPFHKKLLKTISSMVTIIFNNEKDQKRIALFNTATQNAYEGMIITDANNKVIEVNKAFSNIYGYDEDFILGHDPKILSAKKHSKVFYQKMWDQLLDQGSWSGTITNRRADGSEITQWMNVSSLRNKEGEIINYLAIFSDMTEILSSQRQIEFMAYHDALTGLYNKTHLEHVLAGKKTAMLIMLNLDNFSFFNTIYGFETGDKLLKQVANELVNFCKLSQIYRIDADEFALLFDTPTEPIAVIHRIQKHFQEQSLKLDNIELHISFSFGVAHGNETLLQNSSLALKWAKELGKNRYYIFDDTQDLFSSERRQNFIHSHELLHRAFLEDLIVPYFQGIYDNTLNKIDKFEVLVRIKEGDKIYTPNTFLQTANLAGRMPELTKVMIDKSFKIMSEKKHTFSINITEDDISRNYLAHYLEEKCHEYTISPDRVILEILEGISSGGKENHAQQLMELKALGFRLAIDDFGAEYSNFERVLDLEIDFLKIDAKYIRDIDVNPKSLEITRSIAFFAKNSRIPCIAEFVHDQKVQTIISALGISYSQGYFYSKPMPYPSTEIELHDEEG